MIHPEALDLIESFEGCHKQVGPDTYAPYLDPVGIVTIGIGSLWRMDGSRVEMSDPPISYEQAMSLLDRELRLKCEPAIRRAIVVPLHPLSHGALASFTYNLGGGALMGSTLRKVINAQDWGEVPGELAKWRVAKGRVLPGLIRRRAAEAEMFMRGVAEAGSAKPATTEPWISILARAAA